MFSRSLLASNGTIHSRILEKTRPMLDGLKKDNMDLSVEWYKPSGIP